VNGDGCDHNCFVEENWACTDDQGELSICTYLFCGDGNLDPDEECDDDNRDAGEDGCVNCQISLGWKCARSGSTSATPDVCQPACGDGEVLHQYRDDELVYSEACDLGVHSGG